MRTFSIFQLATIANKATELCGMKQASMNMDGYCFDFRGWKPYSEYEYEDINTPQTRFDYVPEWGVRMDFAYLAKWQTLSEWVEKMVGAPMTMYVGTRGEYEDRVSCICIEFSENIAERDAHLRKVRESA